MIFTENYTKEKKTFDITKANIYVMLMMIPLTIVYVLPYFLIWGDGLSKESMVSFLDQSFFPSNRIIAIAAVIIGIIIHELIHGITWAKYTEKGFKSIKFGVMWKMLTPYCHCKEPLKIKHYILGASMPGIILGIIPSIYAIATGNIALLAFGWFFTLSAGGDFIMIMLLKNENSNDFVQDHPTEMGCYIYREEGILKDNEDSLLEKPISKKEQITAYFLTITTLLIFGGFIGYYIAKMLI